MLVCIDFILSYSSSCFWISLEKAIVDFLFIFAETVKLIPQHLVTYKFFGAPEGPHYAHYDSWRAEGTLTVIDTWEPVVNFYTSRHAYNDLYYAQAVHEVYPCIIEFLSQHDNVSSWVFTTDIYNCTMVKTLKYVVCFHHCT